MGREAGRLTLSEDDRRVLAVWAADCADRTLALFEAQASGDTRPRDAIDGLRAFARGELRIGKARALSVGAHAAAREISDPAAVLPPEQQARQSPPRTWRRSRAAQLPTPPKPPGWPRPTR